MAMDGKQVAIIGAGIFGLAAAWACAARGMSVTVYEANRIGAGSSGGVVGAMSPHMPEAWNPKKAFQFRALLRAEAFWREVAELSGEDPGYGRVGRVMPIHTPRARELAEARIQTAQELWQGHATWRVVETAQGMSPQHGAVVESLSARLYPAYAVTCLARALLAKGVTILEQSPVTDPCTLDVDHVVVAAGHWCPQVLPDLALTLRGVKGQAALLDVRLPDDTPVIFDDGLYIIGHGSRGTAIGSTSENAWQDDGPDEKLDAVIQRAVAVQPKLAQARVVQRWAGVRPRSVLPDPVMGEVADGVWLFSGGFKIGFGIAHELAAQLARMISGEEPDMPESFHLAHHLAKPS